MKMHLSTADCPWTTLGDFHHPDPLCPPYLLTLAMQMAGSKKIHNWNRRPLFAYSLCNFCGSVMMINGRLLRASLMLKPFSSKISESCQNRT